MSTRSQPFYKKRKGFTNAHPWRDGCSSNKFRFASPEQALLYAMCMPTPMTTYRHSICGGWHLTTNDVKEEMHH